MKDYLIFWLARPLAEFTFCLLVLIGITLIIFLAGLPRYFRQRRCTHDQVFETQACDAICAECGKNLGFIQIWRDKKAKRENP